MPLSSGGGLGCVPLQEERGQTGRKGLKPEGRSGIGTRTRVL